MEKAGPKGRSGERKFDELCENAGLIVSEPKPDSTGKDRIVEFELASLDPLTSYDRRLGPMSCYFQIKTTERNAKSVRMRLSNAERLIRDPKPTFVFVCKMSRKRVMKCFLVPIDEEHQSRILRRLREEQKAGNRFINRSYCSVPFDDSRLLDDGDDLAIKNAILQHAGTDMFRYADRKRKNLENLGYSSERYSLSIQFEPIKSSEFLDGLLGLRDLPVSEFRSFERRFGIDLPDHFFSKESSGRIRSAALSIVPSKTRNCQIEVFNCHDQMVAILDGKANFAALPNRSCFKILINTVAFRFLVEDTKMKVTSNEGFDDELTIPVLDWLSIYRAWNVFASGNFGIRIHDGKFDSKILKLRSASCLTDDSEALRNTEALLYKASELLRIAGVGDCSCSMKKLISEHRSILLTYDRMVGCNKGDSFEHYFEIDSSDDPIKLPHDKCIYVDVCLIGDVLLGYALGCAVGITSSAVEFSDLRQLLIERIDPPCPENLLKFQEKLRRISGIPMVFCREISIAVPSIDAAPM